MLEEMSSIIYSTAKDSWILEKILAKAIGRKASSDGNGTIFVIGQKSYIFQRFGNSFVENFLQAIRVVHVLFYIISQRGRIFTPA